MNNVRNFKLNKLKTKLIYWLLKDVGVVANCKIDEQSLVTMEFLAERDKKKINYINVEVVTFDKTDNV